MLDVVVHDSAFLDLNRTKCLSGIRSRESRKATGTEVER